MIQSSIRQMQCCRWLDLNILSYLIFTCYHSLSGLRLQNTKDLWPYTARKRNEQINESLQNKEHFRHWTQSVWTMYKVNLIVHLPPLSVSSEESAHVPSSLQHEHPCRIVDTRMSHQCHRRRKLQQNILTVNKLQKLLLVPKLNHKNPVKNRV